MAAASSGIRVGRALPALVLGSSVFLQAHLLLGYALGPAARSCWMRGRRGRATRVLAEGACPVCLAAGLLGGAGRPAPDAEAPHA